MELHESLQILWYVLIVVLFLGYSLLDGFDLGVGILLPFLAKNKEEKDTLIDSIGPFWDGNEVWLITGGGALFAAFPIAYATAFSGFYLATMLILFALIFRAVSMEFRAHSRNHANVWEAALVGGSFVAALLFGVALGNVVYGVPLDNNMEYAGKFFTLLRPIPLLFGIMGLSAILLQGSSYIIMKTEGDIKARAEKLSKKLFYIFVSVLAVFVIVTVIFINGALTNYFYVLGFIISLAGIFLYSKSIGKSDSKPFWLSSITFIGLWVMVAGMHFPNLIKSSLEPINTINIFNSSTSVLTLKIMAIIAVIGMPIVIGYTIFVYKLFKGKVKPGSY